MASILCPIELSMSTKKFGRNFVTGLAPSPVSLQTYSGDGQCPFQVSMLGVLQYSAVHRTPCAAST